MLVVVETPSVLLITQNIVTIFKTIKPYISTSNQLKTEQDSTQVDLKVDLEV